MYLEENIINLTKNKESLFHVLKEYSSKRTELIATLFTIFPITEVRLYTTVSFSAAIRKSSYYLPGSTLFVMVSIRLKTIPTC